MARTAKLDGDVNAPYTDVYGDVASLRHAADLADDGGGGVLYDLDAELVLEWDVIGLAVGGLPSTAAVQNADALAPVLP